MEDDPVGLDGGIKDDDISETMAQEVETHEDPTLSPAGTTSPAANLNNDL